MKDTAPTHQTRAALAALAHFHYHGAAWTILHTEDAMAASGPDKLPVVTIRGMSFFNGKPTSFGYVIDKPKESVD